MNGIDFLIYMIILVGSTYLIRVLPFVLSKKKIGNTFIRSFLYYIPYAVLMAMTFPACILATGSVYTALIGIVVAFILAYMEKGLTVVAVAACTAVYLAQLII